MKKKTRLMLVAGVLVLTLGFVSYGMLTLFADPYVSVDAVIEDPDGHRGRVLQVKGFYLPGSLTMTVDNVTLTMYGDEFTILILVTGETPNLQHDQEMVAIGTLEDGMVIHATEILAQCPSKYETNTTATSFG